MVRDVISPKIFEKIISNPKVKAKYKVLQSIRNAISQIHKDNPGITMNAAAYEFARKFKFSVYRDLSPEDKLSLQYLKVPAISAGKPVSKPTVHRVRVKEIKPDFKSQFIQEANDNAKIYPYIYILENSLRMVIFEKFGTSQDWWNDRQIVSKDIQDYAARIQQSEKKYPWLRERGNHPVYYVGLFELFRIIEKNWKSYFSDVFPELELLRMWIKESVPVRNLVAHNVKTRLVERQNIIKNTDYICRLVERWHVQHKSSDQGSL